MKKTLIKICIALLLILSFFTVSCKKNEGIDSYKLYNEINAYLELIESNGIKEEIKNKWYSLDETKKVINYDELTGENGTIKIACTESTIPFSYNFNGENVGFSLDIIFQFAKAYKYDLVIYPYPSYAEAVTAISTGKCDIAAGAISVTEERMKSVCFSDGYYDDTCVCVTLKENATKYNSIESLKNMTIGTIAGSISNENCEKEIEGAKIKEYKTISDISLALQRGDICAYFIDGSEFDFFALTNDTDVKTFDFYYDEYAFVLKKFGYQSLSELNGKLVGTTIGSAYDKMLRDIYSEDDIIYYDSIPLNIQALLSGDIEAFSLEKTLIKEAQSLDYSLYYFDEPLGSVYTGAAFPKNESGKSRCDDFNVFLSEIKANGKLDEILNKWNNFEEEGFDAFIDYESLPNINGVLNVATCACITPSEYYVNNKLAGYDIEIVYEYCKSRGYAVNFSDVDIKSIINSLSKNDMALASLSITEERKESVYFSDPYKSDDVVMICKANTISEKTNFFENISDSFYKTFIKENRYQLFLKGILNTVLITIFSIIGGLILGTFLFIICRTKNKVIIGFIKVYSSILKGIPELVTLMILYYIIFNKSSLNAIVVSIICFSMIFSISVYSQLVTSVSTIDVGQFEAATALGYSKTKGFIRVIVPQVLRLFFVGFRSDVVVLIKATAIAGYIAIQDLTKVSDIIRSRTYEAFFPLIVSAIIYYVLAFILVKLSDLIPLVINKAYRNSFIEKGE